MVWSTTQSALYNDLSRYYEDEKKPRKNSENTENSSEKTDEKCCNKLPEKCPRDCDQIIPENCCKDSHENCGIIRSEKPAENHPKKDPPACPARQACPNCPHCPNYPNIRQTPSDPISRIISDKDMLLIAGLIFLLMKQGADQKLILALAFVLLS